MKKLINNFSRVLCALMLCAGIAFVGCTDDPLGKDQSTEQGGSGNNGNDNNGESDDNAGVSGVMRWSLDKVTEVSATFTGTLAVAASDLPFSQVSVYYSDAENFNINEAKKVSTTNFDADQKFTITVTGLKPGAQYNYCLIAKVKSEETYGEVKEFMTESLVAPSLNDATDVTEASAVISGTVSIASVTASDLEYGIQYSATEDFSTGVTSRKITDIDSENRFSLQVSSLVPGAAYYYRSYIKMNGVYGYGEIKSFTAASLVAPALNAASAIEMCSAVISGKVNFPSETVSRVEYGFQYCQSADLASNVTTKKVTDLDSENKFSVEITSLTVHTTYYYRSYIKMNGVYGYGEIKSFTTKGPVVPTGYTNLSAAETANCYIISQSGSYCFLIAKGNNSSELLHLTESASLLWESFGTSTAPGVGDLIKSVSYKDGYIVFQTADTFKEGNAVIAAKNSSGTILWSWHIWFTDHPQGQEYYNNAGTMMDRNLGATSATPGDVGALGLLYQWGRKDPFLGSSSISSSILAKSTISWPSTVNSNSSNGTIFYATAHPTTFITYNKSNYDWYYTGSYSTDNTRWTASYKAKSIYDPCPAGWRVPDGDNNGVWSKALGSSSGFDHTYSSSNKGMNFSSKFGSASTIWYPASGCRDDYDGTLCQVGYVGYYWSASPYSFEINYAYYLRFSNNGGVFPSNTNSNRAHGQSVRCLQE